jgi:hypothetical protein
MRTFLAMGLLAFLLISSNDSTSAAQSGGDDLYQEWVDFRNGEITLAFNQTPLRFALHAIQAKTGFQIVVPSNNEVKLVDLRLDRQPFEPAMRSFITTIGYKNFALIYDQEGRPHRAVVVSARPNTEATPETDKNKPVGESLSAEEREKLKKDLERWPALKQEERGRVEDRLKSLPPSDEREGLVKEYGRQILANKN